MRNLIGSLPSQIIREMIAAGYLLHGSEANIQPASLDLSITDTVYRMKGTFLPRPGEKIDDFFSKGALYKASLDYPLELNGIYLIKLREKCNLPEDIYAYTNNKSTTGRINLQTRLIANGVSQFDHIPKGYKGDIWLEVVPKSFPIKLHAGAKLNQIRFFNGDTRLNRLELEMIYDQYQILFNKNGSPVPKQERYFMDNGITMTVDLDSEIAGYKCIPSTNKYLDFKKEEELNPTDFFEPITRPKTGELYLKRDEFYIQPPCFGTGDWFKEIRWVELLLFFEIKIFVRGGNAFIAGNFTVQINRHGNAIVHEIPLLFGNRRTVFVK